jgi:hypothetical protein
LNDYIYSGEVLTFTFFINVSGPFDYLYIAVPSVTVVAVGIVSAAVFMKGKRKKKKGVQKAGRTELK